MAWLVVYLVTVEPDRPLRYHSRVGARELAHCTGLGKVLLAIPRSGPAFCVLVGKQARRRSPAVRTFVTRAGAGPPSGICGRIARKPRQACAVCSAVRDGSGQTVAAISISGAAVEFAGDAESRLLPEVIEAGLNFRGVSGSGWSTDSRQAAVANMDELRMAVVGLGSRGTGAWFNLLQQVAGYRITAIYDPIEALRERALARLQRPQEVTVHRSYEDVLADPNVDAVALTVRCKEQGALAAQALEAGKHVNAEVPARIPSRIAGASSWLPSAPARSTSWRNRRATGDSSRPGASLVAPGKLGQMTLCEGQYFHYRLSSISRIRAPASFTASTSWPPSQRREPPG